MPEVVHHALLAVAAAALAGSALRLASLAAASGPERVLAAVTFAVAAVVVETLALGRVGLGGEPVALGGAAIATWLVARRFLAAPVTKPSEELFAWLRGLGRAEWLALAATAGTLLAWLGWWLWRPALGADSVQFHLPEALTWIHEGDAGAIHEVNSDFPLGNYPVTNQVLISWALGIARSFAPLPVLSVGAMALLVIAGLSGLRALGVPRVPAALATLAVAGSPIAVAQTIGPNTDLPSLAWLACCASLAASSLRRPTLLAPAIVAGGLAVGTKTTPVLFVALALALALWAGRSHLRRLSAPLGAATLLAVAVGGIWYLRNLIDHGSPLWPFLTGPTGDPRPEFLELIATTGLIDRPRATLEGRVGYYEDFLAGALLLMPAALVAPFVARRRAVIGAAVATAAGFVLWTTAPFTGIPDGVPSSWLPALAGLAVNASRYLLPVIAAAAVTVALAGRSGGRVQHAANAVLAAVVLWNLVRVGDLSNAAAPPLAVLLAGAAVAGAAAAVVSASRAAAMPARLAGPVVLAALVLLLAAAAPEYPRRHTEVALRFLPGYEGTLRALLERDDYRDGDASVASAPMALGTLAGDRLRHAVELIPPDEPCAAIERRAATQWVVIYDGPAFEPFAARTCFGGRQPLIRSGPFRVYRGSTAASQRDDHVPAAAAPRP
jgi:hypothetical protein